jgi:tetratricopeptide (TPR) repeat protein
MKQAIRLPILILIPMLILGPNRALAQEVSNPAMADVKSVQEKIAQKIKMVNRILHSPDLLQRVESSVDQVARDLLVRASQNFLNGEEYFDRGQYLEAEAVLDYVLRDLSASSRLLSMPQQQSNEYSKLVEQLDSFTLPEWSDLSEAESEMLEAEMVNVSQLRDQAARFADASSYDEAIALLEQAYQIKVSLLEKLRHETTIVYDLNFDTVQDEYSYLINRTYHYLELVQTVLEQSELDEQTRKLTDKYLYGSMLNLEKAEDFEFRGQFSEAIPVLDKSIDQLSAVLKILGITI